MSKASLEALLSDPEKRELARKEVLAECWRQGVLEYRLTPTQQLIHARLKDNPARRHFLLCSRRLGKTDLCFTRCVEVALQKANARVLFIAPYSKDAALIARDTAAVVLKDCPPNLKPTYHEQAKEFRFPNGSIIRLAGVNSESAQQLRGGSADLVVLDEGAMMDDFQHVVNGIVSPMLMTTRGHLLIATTPPRTPGHESTALYEQYAARGWVSKYTLRDADDALIPFEEKIRALMNAGESEEHARLCLAGKAEPKTTEAQREYWTKFVVDASLALVPEFTAEKQQEIVREHKRPPYFDYYAGLDPGSRDGTGIVYAYVDFVKAKIVVEAEALLSNPGTDEIVSAIKTIERDVFQDREPRARISDIDVRLQNDLNRLYGIRLAPADKRDGVLASVQLLRHMVKTGTLIINPKCVHTIRQLTNAIWDRKGRDMGRAEDDSPDAHYDLVAALRYMLRGINLTHNPYPDNYHEPGGEGGTPLNRWISPKTRKEKSWGLFTRTPLTAKIMARANKKKY